MDGLARAGPIHARREPIDRDSFVKQPWSTASTFAFCAVGLVILGASDRDRRRSAAQPVHHLTSLGFVALAMGPGSAVYHGTLTSWGGFFDQMSIYGLLSFIVACDVARLADRRSRFGSWFWGSLAVATVVTLVSGDAGTPVFIAVAIGVGLFALVAWSRLSGRVGVRRSGRRLALAFAALGAAIVPWVLSNPGTGDPTDVPYHSAWHVLSAAFVAAYWWYLRSEVTSAPSRTGGDARVARAPA